MQPHTQPWLDQVNIRLLAPSDLPGLEWGGEYIHFRRLYQEIYQGVEQGRAVMWVATLPGKGVIGQLFVQLVSGRRELADGETRAYIYGFRLQAPYRNLGVGSRMLQQVEADLQQRKFIWVTLNVGRLNHAARRFYERHGYRVVANEPGQWSYLDHLGNRRDVNEPAWRMEKKMLDIT